ncbi:MAG: type II toxin-antitoxin system RelB/DinJ family antitoxin [Defluviitaleaceae bacterium]|nr:type II toxin-antitoxin system RelB/DinJ family antitoxin [Defluviitaleaceae bacterium]
MAEAMINFRMDEDLISKMEQTCNDMGISVTTAFTIFATKVAKERRIPFDVVADPDPFYQEANMNKLRQAIADVESGKARLTEHQLLEVEDD